MRGAMFCVPNAIIFALAWRVISASIYGTDLNKPLVGDLITDRGRHEETDRANEEPSCNDKLLLTCQSEVKSLYHNLSQCKFDIETYKSGNFGKESPFLRKFLRLLLDSVFPPSIDVGIVIETYFSFSSANLQAFELFLQDTGTQNAEHVHHMLLNSVIKSEVSEKSWLAIYLDNFFEDGILVTPIVLFFISAMTLVYLFIRLFYDVASKSTKAFLGLFFVLLFMLDTVFTYIRLLKDESARQITDLGRYESACENTYTNSLWNALYHDGCYEYNKHIVTESFWRVTPLLVITQSCTGVMIVFFKNLGISMQGYFSNVNPMYWLVSLLAIFCFSLLALGYRFKTFFFTIEKPGQSFKEELAKERILRLEKEIEYLKAENSRFKSVEDLKPLGDQCKPKQNETTKNKPNILWLTDSELNAGKEARQRKILSPENQRGESSDESVQSEDTPGSSHQLDSENHLEPVNPAEVIFKEIDPHTPENYMEVLERDSKK